MYLCNFRRGIGGLPTRLMKGRSGSVQSGNLGDAESLQDESSLDGEENDKSWRKMPQSNQQNKKKEKLTVKNNEIPFT